MCPSKHRHGATLFIRLFRETAAFSRLLRSRWGYGGHILDLTPPPGPSRGRTVRTQTEVAYFPTGLWHIYLFIIASVCIDIVLYHLLCITFVRFDRIAHIQMFARPLCFGVRFVLSCILFSVPCC